MRVGVCCCGGLRLFFFAVRLSCVKTNAQHLEFFSPTVSLASATFVFVRAGGTPALRGSDTCGIMADVFAGVTWAGAASGAPTEKTTA